MTEVVGGGGLCRAVARKEKGTRRGGVALGSAPKDRTHTSGDTNSRENSDLPWNLASATLSMAAFEDLFLSRLCFVLRGYFS